MEYCENEYLEKEIKDLTEQVFHVIPDVSLSMHTYIFWLIHNKIVNIVNAEKKGRDKSYGK
jgi:hypothetical protein